MIGAVEISLPLHVHHLTKSVLIDFLCVRVLYYTLDIKVQPFLLIDMHLVSLGTEHI